MKCIACFKLQTNSKISLVRTKFNENNYIMITMVFKKNKDYKLLNDLLTLDTCLMKILTLIMRQ